jgi:hypothetical protein
MEKPPLRFAQIWNMNRLAAVICGGVFLLVAALVAQRVEKP